MPAPAYTRQRDVVALLVDHLRAVLEGSRVNFVVPIVGDYRQAVLAHLGSGSIAQGHRAGLYVRLRRATPHGRSSGGAAIGLSLSLESYVVVDASARERYEEAVYQGIDLLDALLLEVFHPALAEEVTPLWHTYVQKVTPEDHEELEAIGTLYVWGVRHVILTQR
jgi:hypothetical protein